MTRGDKGKLFSLFVRLFTLPTQQDCVLPVDTHVMSPDKYQSIFSCQKEAIVYLTKCQDHKGGISSTQGVGSMHHVHY